MGNSAAEKCFGKEFGENYFSRLLLQVTEEHLRAFPFRNARLIFSGI